MEAAVAVPGGTFLRPRTLLAIFLLALGVRGIAWYELADGPWMSVLLGDSRSYDDWARRIAGGDWLGQGVFYQAPLYPYGLGLLYALAGPSLALVRALQVLGGALAATLLAGATTRLCSPRAGLAAGLLAALYAPAIEHDLLIEKSSPAWFLSALLLWLLVARREAPPLRGALPVGVLLGALTLLRENAAILILPVAFGYLGSTQRWRAVGALLLGFALVLLPVGLRNGLVGGSYLPSASNAGVNFYIGNGLDADGLYRPLVPGRGHPDFERQDAERLAQELSGRALSPAGVSAFWFGTALREIASSPTHFVGLLGRKARLLASRVEIMDALAPEVLEDGSRVLDLLARLVRFGVLLPLFVAGLVLARGRGRLLSVPAWCALALAAGLLAFFVAARFRLGIVPFLIPHAALALVELTRSIRAPVALSALVATAALSWWPLRLPGDPRATSYANLASELLRRSEFPEAERWARTARMRDPGSAEAAYTLGIALRQQGRNDEALEPLEDARRLEPAYAADVLAELGAMRALAGDPAAAAELLDEALRLDPGHEAALRYRATLRAQTGR